MTKQSGLGDNLYVGGYDLSGDTATVAPVRGGPAAMDVQGIDKSAYERIGGRRDGGISWVSYFNPTAGQAHPVLSALPTADVLVSYLRGTSLGDPAACCIAKQINYDPTRGADGSLTMAVQAEANQYGLEWGNLLTPGKETDTGAANGTGVNLVAETSFGLQAYLHVFSFTGTNATIKIQESSNDGGDAYEDVVGGAFTLVDSAPTTERIATATGLTVEKFLRAVTVTGSAFSEMTFAVIVVKNTTVPVF